MRPALILLLLVLPLPLGAADLTYSGDNVLRLKCATMLSLAGRFALRDGRISPEEAGKSRAAAAHLLKGLPGNNDEKGRAMQAMADRMMLEMKPDELKDAFHQTLPGCARFF